VKTRILHVSDLHIGTSEDPDVKRAIVRLIEQLVPELIVCSGDLTHRGTAEQHDVAGAFLRSFGIPVHAIPGNHDLPYSFPGRFTRTWKEFERVWETTQPVYRSDRVVVVGLRSPRPWLYQEGFVRKRQLEWAREQLRERSDGAFRIVSLHHHLLGAPWRSGRKLPVAFRNRVLASLVESGAELVVAGHIHQAAISERREFEVVSGDVRGVVISIAPGLGQPRPRRQGEARGLHVYEAGESEVLVSTYIWRDDDWALTAERRFPRGLEPLAVERA
jgi:3',5'-cyclic AMP phosphodiesterase CpdA